MAGLVILWLVIEEVCNDLREQHITLLSDNSPTVGWVQQLASKRSIVAKNPIQALALRLKMTHVCPLTPMHIEGRRNVISDVPSRSFGSNPARTCKTDSNLLTLFNSHLFPLPHQQSWTVYHPNCVVVTRVTSILQTRLFKLDGWRQLPKRGRHVGKIGATMSNLWEWILTYSRSPTNNASIALQASRHEHEQDIMERDDRYRVAVTSTITAVGQTTAMACYDNMNPTKVLGSEWFIPAIQIMIDRYTKADPPMNKKLSVEADVPELLINMGYKSAGVGSTLAQSVGDLAFIAFYYLLHIGEYTIKRSRNSKKQTVRFKLEDVSFFKKDTLGTLRCLPRTAPLSLHFSRQTVQR